MMMQNHEAMNAGGTCVTLWSVCTTLYQMRDTFGCKSIHTICDQPIKLCIHLDRKSENQSVHRINVRDQCAYKSTGCRDIGKFSRLTILIAFSQAVPGSFMATRNLDC